MKNNLNPYFFVSVFFSKLVVSYVPPQNIPIILSVTVNIRAVKKLTIVANK